MEGGVFEFDLAARRDRHGDRIGRGGNTRADRKQLSQPLCRPGGPLQVVVDLSEQVRGDPRDGDAVDQDPACVFDGKGRGEVPDNDDNGGGGRGGSSAAGRSGRGDGSRPRR